MHPTNSFDFGVPRDVVRRRPHLDHVSPRVINDVRVQYAYAKYEVAPPYSHGSWEPGDFGDDRRRYCTAIFNYPSLRSGRLRQQPDGTRKGAGSSRTTWAGLMELGGPHQWKTGVDFSDISFRGDNLGSPLGTWTFPRDAVYNAERSDDVADAVGEHAADLRRDSGQALRDLRPGRLAGCAAA